MRRIEAGLTIVKVNRFSKVRELIRWRLAIQVGVVADRGFVGQNATRVSERIRMIKQKMLER